MRREALQAMSAPSHVVRDDGRHRCRLSPLVDVGSSMQFVEPVLTNYNMALAAWTAFGA
jgi:hypothetical protein